MDLGTTYGVQAEPEGENGSQLSKILDVGDVWRAVDELEKGTVHATARISEDTEKGIRQMVMEDATEPSMDDSVSSSLRMMIFPRFTWSEQNEPVEHIHLGAEYSGPGPTLF